MIKKLLFLFLFLFLSFYFLFPGALAETTNKVHNFFKRYLFPQMDIKKYFLTVQGKKIMCASSEVFLRGVNVANQVGEYSYIEDPLALLTSNVKLEPLDYKRMKEWDVNIIRFPLNYYWLFDTASPNVIDDSKKQALFKYIDYHVNLSQEYGIYLLLDLHHFGAWWTPPEIDKGVLFYDGSSSCDIAKFWETIAKRYKNEPIIAGYDLINEPHCSSSFTENDLYRLYEQTLQVIRDIGDSHMVFISDPVEKFNKYKDSEGEVYGSSEAFLKVSDDNVIYSYHWYLPFVFTHQSFFDYDFVELGATYPLYIFEEEYIGGIYDKTPFWSKTLNDDWQRYSSDWLTFDDFEAAGGSANDYFNIVLSAYETDGRVWFDGICLEELNENTQEIKQISVANGDMSLPKNFMDGWMDGITYEAKKPARWYFYKDSKSFGINYSWDRNTNKDGDIGGSLLIDARSARWSNETPYACWTQGGTLPSYYPIKKDSKYRVSGWLKIKDNKKGNVAMCLNILKVKKTLNDKKYIENAIKNHYEAFSIKHNVPIFCGEFGLTNPSLLNSCAKNSPSDQVRWVKDMMSILNKGTNHWTYWVYNNFSRRPDIFGLLGQGYEDRALINTIVNGIR